VTALVVELGDAPAASVRDALAQALGDPTLEVGYAIDGTAGYVDADGRTIDLPAAGDGRAVTPVAIDGRPVGVIIHDPAVLDDPGLLPSIGDATRLAAANARLRAQVRSQIADVEASRRRLVEAEDDERRRIQVQLGEGTEARLRAVATSLAAARILAQEGASAIAVEQTTLAAWQVERALDDIHELSRGLDPEILRAAGLQDALQELAAAAPIPCFVEVEAADLPPRIGAATYFVCSEALANVSKHARATRASIRVTVEDGWLVIEVADDGAGGADPEGSGLRGLADRVETFGGRLSIDSRPGAGTHLAAEMPLDRGA
jgi:signal transduction histidine kinase